MLAPLILVVQLTGDPPPSESPAPPPASDAPSEVAPAPPQPTTEVKPAEPVSATPEAALVETPRPTVEKPAEQKPAEQKPVEPPASYPFTLNGYAEAYYAWNFNNPSNGITSFRGFDNRHNTFTIDNVELQASWDVLNVVGIVALQVGATPATYYLAEPTLVGTGSVNASSASLWQFVQQANVGYRFPVLQGLLVQGGLFVSPVGPEVIPVKDNWNWSRSDLFFALPFYHTGLHAVLTVDDNWSVMAMLCNGWNTVVDNNAGKSVTGAITYTIKDRLSVQALYFGGPERVKGAPEGDGSWRNLFDLYATVTPTDWLSFLGHVDGGFEPNNFGTSDWIAGAFSVRAKVLPILFVAARGDYFHEDEPVGASHIFFPSSNMGSVTGTLDYEPVDHVAFRLEYRHDQADTAMYFAGAVRGDGTTTPFVPNATSQDTVTLGATAWF